MLLILMRKRGQKGCARKLRAPLGFCADSAAVKESLENVATRTAKVGDKLISTQFPNSISRGFAAVGEPDIAVCLLPGTELAFDCEVECDHPLGFYKTKKLQENVARFRQLNVAYASPARANAARALANEISKEFFGFGLPLWVALARAFVTSPRDPKTQN
jgi:hypothetical protein